MALILVADDEPLIVEFMEMALEHNGHTVIAAVGAEVLRVAETLHLDLILLDIAMPGMDGVEVSQRLRRDPLTADIPIIAMSTRQRLRSTASLMPVNDRLPKPFEVEQLYTKVARWASAN